MADILIPVISEKTDLTLDEAKAEYVELSAQLRAAGKSWAIWLENRVEDRLTFLRAKITDFICEVSK